MFGCDNERYAQPSAQLGQPNGSTVGLLPRYVLRRPVSYSLNVRFVAKISQAALAGDLPLWVVKGPSQQHGIVPSRDTAPYEANCVPVINPSKI